MAADAAILAPDSMPALSERFRELLGDRRLADPACESLTALTRDAARLWGTLCEAGPAATDADRRELLGRLDRIAGGLRDAARFDVRAGELAAVQDRFAAGAADAGRAARSLARSVLLDVRDLKDPLGLVPVVPVSDDAVLGRCRFGVAAGRLAGWAATHYRPLAAADESLVAAALLCDAGAALLPAGLPHQGGGPSTGDHAAVGEALAVNQRDLPVCVGRAIARHHERLDGSGPRGVGGVDLTPADRLTAAVVRFLEHLTSDDARAAGAAESRTEFDRLTRRLAFAAGSVYREARRGDLDLDLTAAALDCWGLGVGEQAVESSGGVAPRGLALTDLGRTRLRLDAAHDLETPHFLADPVPTRRRELATVTAGSDADETPRPLFRGFSS